MHIHVIRCGLIAENGRPTRNVGGEETIHHARVGIGIEGNHKDRSGGSTGARDPSLEGFLAGGGEMRNKEEGEGDDNDVMLSSRFAQD